MPAGIIIFAHGSSVPEANQAIYAVADAVARAGGFEDVETAFLDVAHPDLDEAVTALAARGVDRILVVPYFLTLGIHLQRDLPGIVENLSRIHQGVEIRVTPPLDGHPALGAIVLERVREAFSRW